MSQNVVTTIDPASHDPALSSRIKGRLLPAATNGPATWPAALYGRNNSDNHCIDILTVCETAALNDAGGSPRLQAGDVIVSNCAKTGRQASSGGRKITLILDRKRVRDAAGQDPACLAGHRLPVTPLSRLLTAYMAALAREAEDLPTAHRALAMAAAADMALTILQTAFRDRMGDTASGVGLYQAAHALIERRCSDPELTPARLAASLSCSRAALYRLFARHAQSVSATIWTARLERAQKMLRATRHADLRVNEIAFRSGFVDQPTFNRMFKRRYGMTPGEVRTQ